MARIPEKPEEIFPAIADDYLKVFGGGLISVILYGSGAGRDYVPGRSDINLLVMLSDQAIDGLGAAHETVAKWKKRNVATPLFMTRGYLDGALDSFPVEFMEMKRRHRLLFGEDVLAPLVVDPRLIRLQIERELRGKLLHLRSGYLETEDKSGRIRDLIARSLTAFVSLFAAMLFIKKIEIPDAKRDIIAAAAAAFSFDAAVFLSCEEIRQKADRLPPEEVRAVFRDYLREVGHLCELIDRMEIGQTEAGGSV